MPTCRYSAISAINSAGFEGLDRICRYSARGPAERALNLAQPVTGYIQPCRGFQ